MATTVFLLNGTTSWTVPDGVTSLRVDCIGAGGGGSSSSDESAGGGGGGGGFSRVNALAVTPGRVMSLQVGLGGAGKFYDPNGINGGDGGDTWFGSTSTVLAQGGLGGFQSDTVAPTGSSPPAVGDLKYARVAGTEGFYSTGGAGASGPHGQGSPAPGDGSGRGGAADNGTTPAPTSQASTAQAKGISGTQYDATHGVGSGGSTTSDETSTAGAGGSYGGGGAGSTGGPGGVATYGGRGGDGLIVLTYGAAAASARPFTQITWVGL